jgi:hypothetical protein
MSSLHLFDGVMLLMIVRTWRIIIIIIIPTASALTLGEGK